MFPIGMVARPTAAVALLTLLAGAAACSPAPSADAVQQDTFAAGTDSTQMAQGLALIASGDHLGAITSFRRLLDRNREHYGGNYQLARALDLAGRPVEARERWERFKPMAERSSDSTSLRMLTTRLAQVDSLTDVELMGAGLEFLYSRNLPPMAVEKFSLVLERTPTHYGAHFQIATALDRLGQPAEARKWWVKLLPMAEAVKDTATITTTKTRLAQNP